MVNKGNTTLSLEEILSSVPEVKLLAHYLGITCIPTVIRSPLRDDNNPSFGIYSPDGSKVRYKDFATGDRGGIIDLLGKMWHLSYLNTLNKIVSDNIGRIKEEKYEMKVNITSEHNHSIKYSGDTTLDVKVRDWRNYDIEYWSTFDVPLELLKRANVHPISHYIITKEGRRMVFGADKLAYAYAEFKEGVTSIKVYQPYNKSHFKWISKHDRSVLGLWTLMPEKGDLVCICSSVKDALCLYAGTGIPSICLQGEAYGVSDTAQKVLKGRFKTVCVLLDSDAPGKADAEKLCDSTGFVNVELPEDSNYKDVAEMYTYLKDKEKFKTIVAGLFKTALEKTTIN